MKLLCIDIGGTEIKYCTMEDDLKVKNAGYVPTPMTCLDDLIEAIDNIYKQFKDVKGIAISSPGIIDTENGMVYEGGALRYMHKYNLGKLIKQKTGKKVIIENDGKCAAIAELYAGSLKNSKNGMTFIIGTGIGGGLVINGELVKGPNFQTGEISTINMDINNISADSPYFMCKHVNAQSLLDIYNSKGKNKVKDGREFFKLVDTDPKAKEALYEYGRRVAIQCFNFNQVLDLDTFAIGGGISRGKGLLKAVKDAAKDIEKELDFRGLKAFPKHIVRCKFLSDANLIGAYLAYKQYK